MPETPRTSSFHQAVCDAYKAAGWNETEFWKHAKAADLAWSRASLRNWLGDGKYPLSAVAPLIRALNLPYTDAEAVQAAFPETRWRPEKGHVTAPAPTALAELLKKIDDAQSLLTPKLSELGALTRRLFAHLDDRHYFIGTTTTVLPLLFQPESHPDMLEGRCEAVRKGTLCLLIVPNRDYSSKLRRVHHLTNLEARYDDLVSGFHDFRARLQVYLRKIGMTAEKAQEIAHTRTEMCEWGEFPITPAGWTLSVLGQRESSHAVTRRAIARTPGLPDSLLPVSPGANQYICEWIGQFVDNVLEEHELEARNNLRDSLGDVKAHQLRLEFIRAFRDRMAGLPPRKQDNGD